MRRFNANTKTLYLFIYDVNVIIDELPSVPAFNDNISIDVKKRLYRHILANDRILRDKRRFTLPYFLCVPRRRENRTVPGVPGVIRRRAIQV
jgi:hypothetical protein